MKLSSTVGLVLCGGESRRMGRDKGLIRYHQQPQREHVYNLLGDICGEAHLSCSPGQFATIDKGFNCVVDLPHFSNIGPLGAVLSCLELLPDKDILVVGCDYPFITREELTLFIQSFEPSFVAASFFDKTYEPALAWYSHRAAKQLLEMFHAGEFSLRKFLIHVNAHKYFPRNPWIVRSIDTPVQSERVYKTLENKSQILWS